MKPDPSGDFQARKLKRIRLRALIQAIEFWAFIGCGQIVRVAPPSVRVTSPVGRLYF
jgi:hypothetical protein